MIKYLPNMLIAAVMVLCPVLSFAQQDLEKLLTLDSGATEQVTSTFKSGNLINLRTTETIYGQELDFRVDHRFGDLAGKAGGIKNFFGLDNSTDIRIGFDYGISDHLNVGIARAKGATMATQLYEANIKYRFLNQSTDGKVPFSAAIFGSATAAAVKASTDPTSPISYRNFADRLSYVAQLILARKFSSSLSLALSPTYVHHNYTAFGDQNSLFALGIGGRIKFSKRMAFVADYFLPFRQEEKKDYMEQSWDKKYYNALGMGIELETGGHVFHLNFTNASAIQEAQLIGETTSTWTEGQFRWGFSISRRFSLAKTKSHDEVKAY
jgi:hypothetical protein